MDFKNSAKGRLLRMVLSLIESPKQYTRKELASKFGVSTDTIKKDLGIIQQAGLIYDYDQQNRYFLVENVPYKNLKDLLYFSEEDQALLASIIDQVFPFSEHSDRLKKKLKALYDFGRLGHEQLRKPYLSKIDLLRQAQEEKKVVLLEGYRSSSSGTVRNRKVEPFHCSPPDDMLHSFDIESRKLRHFRISRFTRVRLLDIRWQYENHHVIKRTDPFRINNDNQVRVHIRVKVAAYNELIERYPLTKNYLMESETPGIYDFQGMVNSDFLGLANFILGNYHTIDEILEPDSLIQHLNEILDEMKF